MATRRKPKPEVSDLQQPLDPQDLRPPTTRSQDAPPVNAISSGWPKTAEAALPYFIQVVNAAMAEALTLRTLSAHAIELIVARQCRRWRPSPRLFHTAVNSLTSYCESVHKQEPAIKDFLHRFGPGSHPNVVYEVFQDGSLQKRTDSRRNVP
jgi:hypothetical protein